MRKQELYICIYIYIYIYIYQEASVIYIYIYIYILCRSKCLTRKQVYDEETIICAVHPIMRDG
jgi:hypothetical protein